MTKAPGNKDPELNFQETRKPPFPRRFTHFTVKNLASFLKFESESLTLVSRCLLHFFPFWNLGQFVPSFAPHPLPLSHREPFPKEEREEKTEFCVGQARGTERSSKRTQKGKKWMAYTYHNN